MDQRYILGPLDYLTTDFVPPKQVTDVHLLALAVYHQGKLITYDTHISYQLSSREKRNKGSYH